MTVHAVGATCGEGHRLVDGRCEPQLAVLGVILLAVVVLTGCVLALVWAHVTRHDPDPPTPEGDA